MATESVLSKGKAKESGEKLQVYIYMGYLEVYTPKSGVVVYPWAPSEAQSWGAR